MDHTKFITLDDVKKRGYDLTLEGRLNQGDFPTKEEAADEFLRDCFNSIYNLIEMYKGPRWTELFFEDMSKEINREANPGAYRVQQALKWAILEQTIFIYENGDARASAKVEIDRLGYSQKAVDKLWVNYLLG